MRYVVEIMKYDDIICYVNEYYKAHKLYNTVRNTSNMEVGIYKFSDYVKLHSDFMKNYYAIFKSCYEKSYLLT